jgi:hypothetical protein
MRALLALVFLSVAMLACGGLADSGITEANVRVTGLPQFVCPTSTPVPTNTATSDAHTTDRHPPNKSSPRPGSMPRIHLRATTACQQHLAMRVCPTLALWSNIAVCGVFTIRPTNIPGGSWSGGGVGYGATSTPRPTHTPRPTYTPYPTPTPYIVSENYHMGADVYVGGDGGLQLRFRVSNPRIFVSR